MQGRLLPKYQGRFQAHPLGYWQDEFMIAQKMGLCCIEFICDADQVEKNPLMNEPGIAQIRNVSAQTGVCVQTICADYAMEFPLHSEAPKVAAESGRILLGLLQNAKKLGVTDIVIPCVDQTAFNDEAAQLRFIKNIGPIMELAEKLAINLALETDLPPNHVGAFLDALDSKIFTVNYDTGNSAALGYDPVEELAVYGTRISDIHLKDRLRGGKSVELGTGDTDFEKFFKALAEINYTGPFIMQAYRDDEGLQIFQKQLAWITSKLEEWYYPLDGRKNI